MTTAVVPADDLTPGPAGTLFRTCPATGRRIDLGAQRLIKVHAVASVVSLLIGAIAAVLHRADALAGRAPAARPSGSTASSACTG